MKNLTILVFALLLIQETAFSQPCLPEGITFSSQAEIDNFQTNYPNCTEIEGDVEISGADITNLNGLDVLTAFGGDLLIGDVDGYPYSANPLLNNLTGLDNVTSIAGDLDIRGNDVLTSITGLLNVTSIGGYLRISYNDALISLTGLDNVTSIGGFLWIFFNNALTNLTGLDGFTSIEGSLRIYGNDALISLTGLDNIITIDEYLEINYNDALTSLTGLNNLASIGGYFEVIGNDLLPHLAGLDNLISIVEYLEIKLNNALTSLTGLDNMISIEGYLEIENNSTLTSLSGLDNLTSIGESLTIFGGNDGNSSLSNLTGLDNLISIGGYLEIRNMHSLTSLTGLENLTSIGGHLEIRHNNNLTSLTGIDNIEAGSISDLEISNNYSLSTCDVQSLCDYLASPNGVVNINNNATGCKNPWEIANDCGYMLPCLPYGNYIFTNQADIDNFGDYCDCTELEGNVEIFGYYSISNLIGLNAVTSIGGWLEIAENAHLTSLTGLDNITHIGGDLEVWSNNSLESLTGLGGLTTIEGSINIGYWSFNFYEPSQGNPLLEDLTGLDNLTFIGGNLEIYANGGLKNLLGLENLTAIEGNLAIGGPWNGWHDAPNDSLASLTGLDNLTSIGGDLGIRNNNALTSLSGLENLTSVGGDLAIGAGGFGGFGGGSNAALASISALSNVVYIGGALEVSETNSLINLTGLENITAIVGGLAISDNNALISLTGLDNVQAETISDLIIYENPSLSTCEVLSVCSYLASPNGNIEIHNNAPGCNSQEEVEDACGFQCLPEGITFTSQEEIDNFPSNYFYCIEIEGDVEINGDDIDNLHGLSVLTSIGGDLVIKNNDALSNLEGMIGLTSIGGNLFIQDNPILTDIWGLVNVDALSIGDLHIVNNPSLSECDIHTICSYLISPGGTVNIQNNSTGCNSQEEVEAYCNHHCLPEGITFTTQEEIDNFQINYADCDDIIGNVWIDGEDISNLNGLNGLTSIGGDLTIDDNLVLTSLTGLEGLTYIGGELIIGNYPGGNPVLSSLSGLVGLNAIGDKLYIYGNPSLTSLSGLENIEYGSIEELVLIYNSSLSTCHVESICNYIVSFNAVMEIHDNAPGCDSPEEVQEACWTEVDEIAYDDKFSICPNPLKSNATIKYSLHQSMPVTLQILDLNGRNILILINEIQAQGEQRVKFCCEGLPAGLYFCTLKTTHATTTKKIIKLN